MTSLSIDWEVEESSHNAVVWYEAETAGVGRETGKTITKTHFVSIRTTPSMSTYFYSGQNLVNYIKHHDPNASRGVLYSSEGFEARMQVKKEVDDSINKNSLLWCCLTCGLVCCCFCPCCPRFCKREKNVENLNDDYYCRQLKERYPEKTQDVHYVFADDDGTSKDHL